MNRKSVKTLSAALFAGVAIVTAGMIAGSAPAFSAAAVRVENRALVEAVNKSRPATAKGVFLKKISVSSTMGAGVRVDQASFTQQQA